LVVNSIVIIRNYKLHIFLYKKINVTPVPWQQLKQPNDKLYYNPCFCFNC